MNETRLVSLGAEWMKYSCLCSRLRTAYLYWRFIEYSWFPSEIDEWNSKVFFLFYWKNYNWLLLHIIFWSTTVLYWKLKQEYSWTVLINGTERCFFYCNVYVERAVGSLPDGEFEETWYKHRDFPSGNLPPFSGRIWLKDHWTLGIWRRNVDFPYKEIFFVLQLSKTEMCMWYKWLYGVRKA